MADKLTTLLDESRESEAKQSAALATRQTTVARSNDDLALIDIAKRVIDANFFGWSNVPNNLKFNRVIDELAPRVLRRVMEEMQPKYFTDANAEENYFALQLAKAAFLLETGVGNCDRLSAYTLYLCVQHYLATNDQSYLPILNEERPQSFEIANIFSEAAEHSYVVVRVARDSNNKISGSAINNQSSVIDTWLSFFHPNNYPVFTAANFESAYAGFLRAMPADSILQQNMLIVSYDSHDASRFFSQAEAIMQEMRTLVVQHLAAAEITSIAKKSLQDLRPLVGIKASFQHLLDPLWDAGKAKDLQRLQIIRRLVTFVAEKDLGLLADRGVNTYPFLLLFLARQKFLFTEAKKRCCVLLLVIDEEADTAIDMSNSDKQLLKRNVLTMIGSILANKPELIAEIAADIKEDKHLLQRFNSLKDRAIEKYNQTVAANSSPSATAPAAAVSTVADQVSVTTAAVPQPQQAFLPAYQAGAAAEAEKGDETEATIVNPGAGNAAAANKTKPQPRQ